MPNYQSFWVLSYSKMTLSVLFLYLLFYSQSIFANYHTINFEDNLPQNRQYAQDIVCHFSQDML